MIPPQAAEIFAFEKNTLIRKLREMVAIANDVSIQNINIGLLLVNTAPCFERAAKSAVENDMNRRLVKNQAVQ